MPSQLHAAVPRERTLGTCRQGAQPATQCGDDSDAVFAIEGQQHREARGPLDDGDHMRVRLPTDEVSLPMAGYKPGLDLRGSLTQRTRANNLAPGLT